MQGNLASMCTLSTVMVDKGPQSRRMTMTGRVANCPTYYQGYSRTLLRRHAVGITTASVFVSPLDSVMETLHQKNHVFRVKPLAL